MQKNYTSSIKNKKRRVKLGDQLNFASKEAYNLLRTNISFAFPDRVGGKVLGMCSSRPQEGKSTTSINLAYSLADAGYKVLLIDGDMRRPSIFNSLNVEMSPGLSNILGGNAEEHINHGVLQENLDVITSGDIPPNPSELIGSQKMCDFLTECRKKYDYVVLDLPPILSVSDALAVSKYVDGMILVVRHNIAKRREVAETIRQLDYVNAKIVGFVYNKVETTGIARYYKPENYYKK